MSQKHIEQIITARIAMLLQAPFFGNLSVRLKLKDVTDEGWCKTAATDGRFFYYNTEFIDKLNKQELIFLMGHEVMHCVYDHMLRRGSRDAKLWNIAADFVINLELQEQQIGRLPDSKRIGIEPCYDPKYKGMCAEEVYASLKEESDKNGGKDYDEFDVHLDPESSKDMTEEERAALRDEIRQAVIQAAKAAGGRNGGNIPGGVKRMLKELLEPQMDWREILNMQIQSVVKNDYTWLRQSRKSMYSGVFLPALKNDVKASIAVAIDTSGSMTEKMILDLITEVKGILGQFQDFDLALWCFDTKVWNYKQFTPDNVDELEQYEPMGGGGTTFEANWEFMEENNITPHRFLMFTDGYPCGGWGDPDYCETIFLVHGDTAQSIVAPFGMTIHYTPPAEKQ